MTQPTDPPELTGVYRCPSCGNEIAERHVAVPVFGSRGWVVATSDVMCMCKPEAWEMRKMKRTEEGS